MARQVPEEELEAIVEAVAKRGEAASIGDIVASLQTAMPHRTLQRRVAALVAQGRLQQEGQARASRYRLPESKGGVINVSITDGIALGDQAEAQLPVSAEGREILQHVRAPVQQRNPVGYNREFLDQYRPNQSFYLSAPLRQRLLALGQSVKKVEPAGTYAKKIWNRLLIDLSWNSSRLEGNTYSLLETERLLELGEAAAGKNAEEAQMILNHKAAINLLVEQAEETGFNRYTIQNVHALLADNLLEDPQAVGRLRHIPVAIGGTVFHPLEAPQLIEECFDLILSTAAAIEDPFEQAFFVCVHIPYLQPFEDVNKRVSRLAANIPLIRHNLSPLSFVDVPVQVYIDGLLGVYELNRIELLRDVFVWAYERSCARYAAVRRSLGEPDPFRLRHRDLIGETIKKIVIDAMHKQQAVAYIRKVAESKLNPSEQMRFVEVVETELMSLHEGNTARYRIRPSEFANWQAHWN
ncbi:MAG: Fic family protein [Pseudomonadales bacterium]|nr:Fic family protein [Pseudomonadales bacterium]